MKPIRPFWTMLFAIVLLHTTAVAQNIRDAEPPKSTAVEPQPQEDAVLTMVEQMPEFPGGTAAMMTFLAKQSQYPEDAKEAGIQGRVFLSFVVETDGSLSNIQVLRGVYPSLDREAIRMVKTMPKWNPGKQSGKSCRVKYNLPVMFKLND